MDSFIDVLNRFGFPVALAVFLVWRDWQLKKWDMGRDQRMTDQIRQNEEYIRTTLAEIATRTVDALGQQAASNHAVVETQRELLGALRRCPCAGETKKKENTI